MKNLKRMMIERLIRKIVRETVELENAERDISRIITNIKGKDVVKKRIEALENAGYEVEYYKSMYKFGTSGTVKVSPDNDGFLASLSASRSIRSRKNGYTVNVSDVYKVRKK